MTTNKQHDKNQTWPGEIRQHFSQFIKYYSISMTFGNYFLTRFISKMNNNCFRGKTFIIHFYALIIRGNWVHLA